MGLYKYLDSIMGNKMSGIHTAYLAKVLSVSGKTAKIQPLGLYQNADGTTSAQSVLTKVPICEHVKHYKLVEQSLSVSVSDTYTGGGDGTISPRTHPGHLVVSPLVSGDIVVCLCCEQNISEAKRGNNALPPAGRFNMSDSIIVGVL